MKEVGLEALKDRLREYVRLAESGETVLVMDHERVLARLVPPAPEIQAVAEDELTAKAARAGWITPAMAPMPDPPPNCPTVDLERLLADLAQDREDRR